MLKYQLEIHTTMINIFEIEADNEDEAYEKYYNNLVVENEEKSYETSHTEIVEIKN
jgi:hypothetical protein